MEIDVELILIFIICIVVDKILSKIRGKSLNFISTFIDMLIIVIGYRIK